MRTVADVDTGIRDSWALMYTAVLKSLALFTLTLLLSLLQVV
jgi:hypothetical protein